jgi:hypothetical protein
MALMSDGWQKKIHPGTCSAKTGPDLSADGK